MTLDVSVPGLPAPARHGVQPPVTLAIEATYVVIIFISKKQVRTRRLDSRNFSNEFAMHLSRFLVLCPLF